MSKLLLDKIALNPQKNNDMDELTGIGGSHATGNSNLNPDQHSEFKQGLSSADLISFTSDDPTESLNPSVISVNQKKLENNCKIPLDTSTRREKKGIGRLFFRLYAPVSRWIRKVIAKIQGKKYAEVLRVVHLCQANTRLFQGGWIDTPQKKDRAYGSTLSIDGWVMGKQSQPIAVRLTFNKSILAESPLNIPRPDVVKNYFSKHVDFGHRVNFGYNLLVAIETIPDEVDLQLEAIFPEGKVALAGLLRFSKYGF